ncbi:MAG: hypothetical protein VKO64_04720 [Candidatus Sericytochromatia bacterium]|nr:hypothetical protein [Candidatus Sericytochromatia bacterium]
MLRIRECLAAAVLLAGCDSPLPLTATLNDGAVPVTVTVTYTVAASGTTARGLLQADGASSLPERWTRARSLKLLVGGLATPLTRLSDTQLDFVPVTPVQAPTRAERLKWAVVVDGDLVDIVDASVSVRVVQ